MSVMNFFKVTNPKTEKEVINYLRRLKIYNNEAEWQILDECTELKPRLLYSLLMKRMIDIKPKGYCDCEEGGTKRFRFHIRRIYTKDQIKLIKEDINVFEKQLSELYHQVHKEVNDTSEYGMKWPDTLEMYQELEKLLLKHK